jgi:hypothetical protein
VSDNDETENKQISGYGKPPKHSRFRAGTSGNPKGRPRGSKNRQRPDDLARMILKEGERLVDVKQGGKTETIATTKAIMRGLNSRAMSGDVRAQKAALDIQMKAQEKSNEFRSKMFAKALNYIEDCRELTEKCLREGRPPAGRLAEIPAE